MNLLALLKMHLIDIIGIIGVSMVLVAYFLLNTHKLKVFDLRYQLLNFIGSWMILLSLFYSWNLASVVIEIAWIMISVIGISKSLKARNLRKPMWHDKDELHP